MPTLAQSSPCKSLPNHALDSAAALEFLESEIQRIAQLAVIADLVRCGQAFVDVHSACLSLDSRLSARRETLQ